MCIVFYYKIYKNTCTFDHFSAQLFNVSIDNPYFRPPRPSTIFIVVFCDFGSVSLSIKYVRGEGMGERVREGGKEGLKQWEGECVRVGRKRAKETNKQFVRNYILRD